MDIALFGINYFLVLIGNCIILNKLQKKKIFFLFCSIYAEYNQSRIELQAAAEVFEDGLRDWAKEQVRKAMFGFIGSAIKLAFGIFPCGAAVSVLFYSIVLFCAKAVGESQSPAMKVP